ncbi:NrdH-redoxin [Candidatus Kuenenbacteria bacterium HGW-Kuenenbacteria-1]|uniref:NrdH-redoxin n=1 Tax=Candidatus Kuenenbacteria bacterium HGW-Kuenenbacteria-1 TaxID=2013812 RepID=A0A2N1UMQ5_9BACT|nr:MAG: NrdH-redoxin [Candidatus Kuenenbacteria bacterium HGW-Kuenenbacteria-1]
MAKVIVYSTTVCPYCDMAKKYLEEKRIEYIDKDVSKDSDAMVEMTKKTNQLSIPVIDIDGEIITGFDRKAIDIALKIMLNK